MKKVALFSFLLILGLILSQSVGLLGTETHRVLEFLVKNLSLIFLAFIMIQVGIEFSVDKTRLKEYGWDYCVAFTAATFPWIFCALYFVCVFSHNPLVSKWDLWVDILLLSRFAAPTSAGVLFSMLTAAGLEETWVFKKARILAIFDDLDTILLLIPLKMLIMGFSWQAIVLLAVIVCLIYYAWKKMHSLAWPIHWYFVLMYAVVLAVLCEGVYVFTQYLDDSNPVHLEILLPAFVLGCVLAYPKGKKKIHTFFQKSSEHKAQLLISALFVFLVGLSMPPIEITADMTGPAREYRIGFLSLQAVFWHVIGITLLANLGKMVPLFCYRKEASWKERIALALAMCPRGEVGAGIIILALGLMTHVDKTLVMIAMLSLALNLILTGPLIMMIKKLLERDVGRASGPQI